jgi:Iap family predicted aminopeptidase
MKAHFKNNPLRTLARSSYWQTLYHQAKEINIDLFNNSKDLSQLQIYFLQWLSLYSRLNEDMCCEEEFLTEEIINDDIYCNAYLYYKRHNKNNTTTKREEKNTSGIPKISFTKKNRGTI